MKGSYRGTWRRHDLAGRRFVSSASSSWARWFERNAATPGGKPRIACIQFALRAERRDLPVRRDEATFSRGHSQSLRNAIEGDGYDTRITIGDYRYITGSASSAARTTRRSASWRVRDGRAALFSQAGGRCSTRSARCSAARISTSPRTPHSKAACPPGRRRGGDPRLVRRSRPRLVRAAEREQFLLRGLGQSLAGIPSRGLQEKPREALAAPARGAGDHGETARRQIAQKTGSWGTSPRRAV